MTTHPHHMGHRDLLEEFADLYAWIAGDSGDPYPSTAAVSRKDALEAEILRRMGVPNDDA